VSDPLGQPLGGPPDDDEARRRQQVLHDFEILTEGPNQGDERTAIGLVSSVAKGARGAGFKAVTGGRWLLQTTLTTAEHLPVRSLDELQRHHRGLTGPMLADALVRNASLSSASVGAATGALITAQELVPPSWWVIPFEVAAETALVVAIELKLVGELHEAYGRSIPGEGMQKGVAIATAWSESRGVTAQDLLIAGGSLDLVGRQARSALANSLRRRLSKRVGRSLGSLVPMLIGAGVAAELNRRATRNLGQAVQADLSGVRR
jgi:hypothetical protein